MYFNNDDDYSEQYNYTRVYDKMMEGLMMENNWNKGSIKSKNNLISHLHLDISRDPNKYGYTYKTKFSTVEKTKLEYREVSHNLKYNKILFEYISCCACGEYIEAKSLLPLNIVCSCEIDIYFQRRRCLERIHYKIQYELQQIEEEEEVGIIRY